MDLKGAGGAERFGMTSWHKVLELAQEYGWEPLGTEPPWFYDTETGELYEQISTDPAEEWDGNYFYNSYQHVTDEDAANIADALERALDDIPDYDTDEKWAKLSPSNPFERSLERSMEEQGLQLIGPNPALSPVAFFSGEAKQKIKDFIRYCRAGGFCIG